MLVAAVALGSYALAPALGGDGSLNVKKAKRLFFTKRKANQRFYPRRQADRRFLRSSGDVRLNLHPADWESEDLTTLEITPSAAIFSAPGIASNQDGILPIAVPAQQFGRTPRIVGVEYCYDTVSNSTLDSARLRRLSATGASPNPGTTEPLLADNANHDDAACRTLTPSSPIAIGPGDTFAFDLQVDFAAAGSFAATRTTLILRP